MWQGIFSIPAGSWEYKAALNDSWTENYGTNAQQNGGNIALNLAAPASVKFYYSHTTHWTITLTGKETTQIAYKFTLGDWEHVEKGLVCDEIADRQLTLSHGATGTQTVNITLDNWRNVAPCSN